MKHKSLKIAWIAIILTMLFPGLSFAKGTLPEHTGAFYVNDFANVLNDKTENYMVNYGIKLHRKNEAQVVVVTVDSTKGMPIKEYATSLFNKWGIGSKEKNNGVLLLLSIKDDDYWAVQGKGIVNTLPDSKISEILSRQLEPDFAAKNYSNGVYKTYGSFIQALGGTWTENVGNKTYVSDNAGVFKQVTKDYLNQSSNRYKDTTGNGIYVVTVKNTGGKTLQDYTYMKFASVGAGSKDTMLVLDIGGDNYHVLQGKDVDQVLTSEIIKGILNSALEPSFAKKDYAGGATATANAFYNFFLSRAEAAPNTVVGDKGATPASATQADGTSEKSGDSGVTSGMFKVFLGIIGLFIFSSWRRSRNLSKYGVRYNPNSWRNKRQYNRWDRDDYRHHRSSSSSGSSSSGRRSSGGSNWGGGGSSSGGGAGRRSSGGSSSGNSGGGGSSSGGGSGRQSSSGGGSSGGGGASSGGGVGRH
ncbi:hypothetical protein A8L34_08710 [Bacillus sp. FJAT-27264]|uniref:TPM domain-containing protein n=1 Tax=Paenibacillus sp. (strain DSM 101736 / FJAT-27264) TaxID=1850362 RepID=UPI0008080D53|nr:TPM domain-containing protein [Bacillus sp. FJAT-27264]OBZ14046.1 hypothetical protein A8L34_08710 [Bacillus sp. FJAT-27264]